MSPRRLFLSSLLMCAVVLGGCTTQAMVRPPEQVPRSPIVAEPSVMSMPVQISVLDIQRLIAEAIPEPISKGRTDRINARLLAVDETTVTEFVDELVSAYQPARIETRFREGVRTVREAYKCLLNPGKWGKCWRDVVEVILIPYEVEIAAVEAVYRKVSKDITRYIDQVFKVGIWVNHTITCRDVALSVDGDKVTLRVVIRADISIDYEQAVVPLGPKMKIKGLLNGDVEVEIAVVGTLSVADNGKVGFSMQKDGVHIDFTKIVLPTAVEGVDIVGIIRPQLIPLVALLGDQLDRQVTKRVDRALAKQGDFSAIIQGAVKASQAPIELGRDLWLTPGIDGIAFGQPTGSGGVMTLDVGLGAHPVVAVRTTPPTPTVTGSVPVRAETLPRGVTIYPTIDVSYELAAAKIKARLLEVLPAIPAASAYDIGLVRLYPSDKSLVVSVDIIRRSSGKLMATAFLSGTLQLNADAKTVTAINCEFTAESRTYISAAAFWFLSPVIHDAIKQPLVFSYADSLDAVAKMVGNISQSAPWGKLTGGFNTIDVAAVTLTGSAVRVIGLAKGHLEFVLSLPDPASEKALSDEETDMLLASEQDVLLLSRFGVPVRNLQAAHPVLSIADMRKLSERSLPNHKSLASPRLVIKEPILAPKQAYDPAIKQVVDPAQRLPFISAGDTIYFTAKDGTTQSRVARTKDVTLIGETVYVLQAGVVQPYTRTK